MARSQAELQELLEGVEGPAKVYFQPPSVLQYPCILYQRSDSYDARADNTRYLTWKRYDVTVMDRDPDSLIPDQVESLPHSKFNRFFVVDGLNHWIYTLYF
jgi:hypothetical protein